MVNRWLLRLVSSDSYFKSFIIVVTLAVFSYLQTEQHVAGPVPVLSVYNFIRRGLVRGLAEKNHQVQVQQKSGLEYYKSAIYCYSVIHHGVKSPSLTRVSASCFRFMPVIRTIGSLKPRLL